MERCQSDKKNYFSHINGLTKANCWSFSTHHQNVVSASGHKRLKRNYLISCHEDIFFLFNDLSHIQEESCLHFAQHSTLSSHLVTYIFSTLIN